MDGNSNNNNFKNELSNQQELYFEQQLEDQTGSKGTSKKLTQSLQPQNISGVGSKDQINTRNSNNNEKFGQQKLNAEPQELNQKEEEKRIQNITGSVEQELFNLVQKQESLQATKKKLKDDENPDDKQKIQGLESEINEITKKIKIIKAQTNEKTKELQKYHNEINELGAEIKLLAQKKELEEAKRNKLSAQKKELEDNENPDEQEIQKLDNEINELKAKRTKLLQETNEKFHQ